MRITTYFCANVVWVLALALCTSSCSVQNSALRAPAFQIIELRGDGAALGESQGKQLGPLVREFQAGLFAKVIDADSRAPLMQGAKLFEPLLAPEHLAEIKSLAAASQIDPPDVMLLNCALDLMPMQACSSICVPADASPDHVARLARNLDFPSYGLLDRCSVVFVYHPANAYGFVTIGWPGMVGALSGMNEHGLTLANMEVTREARKPAAMPYMLLYRTVLEKSKTVDEAIELLKNTPRQTPNNLMLMDAAGDRAVVELTPEKIVVRPGKTDAALISTNHQRGDDNDSAGRCNRYDYLHDTAAAGFGKLDVAKLKSMLQHVQQDEMTIQSMVFEPANRVVYLSTGIKAPDRAFEKIEVGKFFK